MNLPVSEITDLTDEEKVLIFSLGALENTPLRTKLMMQKLIFLFTDVFQNFKILFRFEPHLIGPYSEPLENILQELIKMEIIDASHNSYRLSGKGMQIYNNLNPKKEIQTVINDFKSFLFDLNEDEILAFIYFNYPDFVQESAKYDKIKGHRIDLAISLFKKEKISFSKAVEISGLNPLKFDELLKKRGIRWRK